MRLVLEATHVPVLAQQKFTLARTIMFDAAYDHDKSIIMGPIARFQSIINSRAARDVAAARSSTRLSLTILTSLAFLVLAAMAVVLWVSHAQMSVPITVYSHALRHRDKNDLAFALTPAGPHEPRALAEIFNKQFQENQRQLRTNQQLVSDLTHVVEQVTGPQRGDRGGACRAA